MALPRLKPCPRPQLLHPLANARVPRRAFCTAPASYRKNEDPRYTELGHQIVDDYAQVRGSYRCPEHPLVLAHGLLGFDEIHLAGSYLPGIQYWRGIINAFTSHGVETITCSVPASASIEERAAKLGKDIEQKAGGKSVNIIAHSMGGLDARYMISRLKPPNVKVLSLTTIATPHRGSAVADRIFHQIGEARLPQIYRMLNRLSLESGAFQQLTRRYMREHFNPATPDLDGVKYLSYGAATIPAPWSVFRQSYRIVKEVEGANDGLVSVSSSQWGHYKGTLMGVSHLDLINWTNRLRWLFSDMIGKKRNFNAIALYLSIAEMLADEGF